MQNTLSGHNRMKKIQQFSIFLLFLGILVLSSCRKDFSTQPSMGNLEFSKDTVYLDTIFSGIGSSTYTLKVYNRSNDAINIPHIVLANGEDSGYRLNVDGMTGKHFEDITLLAKDSLYVFVETTINYEEVTTPIYEDRILFDSGEYEQHVNLVTLVKDAHFLYPNKVDGIIETLELDGEQTEIQGRYLTDDELVFTNDKPYVIYGEMVVGTPDNAPKTLTIEAGAQIHFHANSGLIVNANSSLHILGTKNIEGEEETEVMIQGDRLEPFFENKSSQWNYILLRSGSKNHSINYATIKNGTAGIVVQGMYDLGIPILEINNTKILNQGIYGIYAGFTNIKGTNLVTNNIGRSAFVGVVGGVYNFTHCTFANYWSESHRSFPTLLLTNYIEPLEDPIVVADLYEANFTNCIIYGRENIELTFDKKDEAAFNFKFTNCLIRFNDIHDNYTSPLYDFDDSSLYENCVFNEAPVFLDPSLNQLIIGEDSAANGLASPSGTALSPLDIMGVTRSNPADLGAYEHVVFEEE